MKVKKHISISKMPDYEEDQVELKGWVYNLRSSGKIGFLVLRDGSGWCQCVVRRENFGEEKAASYWEVFKNLRQEDAVRVEGMVKKCRGTWELQTDNISYFSGRKRQKNSSEELQTYPLGKKNHGVDFLFNHRHLWLRSKGPWAVLRIRQAVSAAIHAFFAGEEFMEIAAPVLTPTHCEGSASLFPVQFFDGPDMFLSQSAQLYMEAAAAAFAKVYCFNPVFRAEKSSTRRHLLEFWMVEPEMAFYDLRQSMELAGRLIEYIVKQVLQKRQPELAMLKVDLNALERIKTPFPRLSYIEAVDLLKKKGINMRDESKGFGGEEETVLSSCFDKPVFVHHYPLASKAFYMKTDPVNPQYCLSFDLLGTKGVGELIGGSEREDDLEQLKRKMELHSVEKENMEWYLDLRRYGSFPHSGFGSGGGKSTGMDLRLKPCAGKHCFSPSLWKEVFLKKTVLDPAPKTGGKLQELKNKYKVLQETKAKPSSRMSARERLQVLLDPESFTELDPFVVHRCYDFNMQKNAYSRRWSDYRFWKD